MRKRKPRTVTGTVLPEPPTVTPAQYAETAHSQALGDVGQAAQSVANYGLAILILLGFFFLTVFDAED